MPPVPTPLLISFMLIKSIQWQSVAVPFRRPFRTSSSVVRRRYSLLVWVETDDGLTGLGEAPASLVSGPASLRSLERSLESAAPTLLGAPLASPPTLAPPSLTFALETAALDCLAQSQGRPLAALLGGSPRPVEVNAIIGEAAPDETEDLALKAVGDGFGTLKLKVGGRDMGLDEEALSRTRKAVGDSVKLRLDANRAWTEDEATLALGRLSRYSPEFIEEPVTPADIPTLSRVRLDSPMPIAADESVEDARAASALVDSAAVDILIVKLARVGGLTVARAIIERARAAGIEAVITSSLETGIGLAAAVHLAAAMDLPRACGLATGPLLTHDLLQTPLAPDEGFLPTPHPPGPGISPDLDAIQRFALAPRRRVHP